jgi:hypothetical protein
MSDLYRRYEVNEDMPVRFVGIHPVRWQPEWGTPQAMFAEAENADLLAAACQLPEVKALVEAANLCINIYGILTVAFAELEKHCPDWTRPHWLDVDNAINATLKAAAPFPEPADE